MPGSLAHIVHPPECLRRSHADRNSTGYHVSIHLRNPLSAITFSPFLFIQSAPAFSSQVELGLTLRQLVLREAFGAGNKRKLEAFAEMIGQNRPQTIRPASQAKLLGIV